MSRKLNTTREVIAALGGIDEVAKLTKTTYSNAANWNSWTPFFPTKTYPVMMDALIARGHTAPDALWKITPRRRVHARA